MAAPVVAALVETSFSTASLNHNVVLSATIAAGDLLVIQIAVNGQTSYTTPTGWDSHRQINIDDADAFHPWAVFARIADGSEGGTTVNIATEHSTAGAAQAMRITGHAGTLAALESIANSGEVTGSTSFDVPSFSPSWGEADTLWLPLLGAYDDDVAVSGYPPDYTNGVDTVSGAGTNAGVTIASCQRALTAATEDPGAFTLASSENGRTMLLAVEPAAGDTTAPTLTNASASSTGTTTGSWSVDTDEGDGTLYWVTDQGGTPTQAQVKAGQGSDGTAADDSGSQAISSTGTKTGTTTGLTASATYNVYFMHEDSDANQSSVVASNAFTTNAAGNAIFFGANF